jgi:hypothetical protein
MKKAKNVLNRLYPIAYTVAWFEKNRRKSVKELQEMRVGGADSILVINIQKSDEGVGAMVTSIDGDTGKEMTDDLKFALWGVMAQQLAKSKTLTTESKKILKQVSGMFNTEFAPKKPGGYVS